jgi:MraZ protein
VNRKIRDLERFFFSGAVEVYPDKQGRILIPPHLRHYAKLKKEVVLVGVVRKFEIWDVEFFESKRQKLEANFDHVMDDLTVQGFELRI